jgi:hypothetical protein
MNPVTAALWITKFVVTLALLLVVMRAVFYYGGVYAVVKYERHKRERKVQECIAKSGKAAAKADVFDDVVKKACELNPDDPYAEFGSPIHSDPYAQIAEPTLSEGYTLDSKSWKPTENRFSQNAPNLRIDLTCVHKAITDWCLAHACDKDFVSALSPQDQLGYLAYLGDETAKERQLPTWRVLSKQCREK